MSETIISFLLIISGIFCTVAGIGLLRFPDVFMRMHASTKAGTLGVGLSVVSAAIFFGNDFVTTKAVLIVLFVLLTAPVAAHLIARAAYRTKTPLWGPTIIDDESRASAERTAVKSEN